MYYLIDNATDEMIYVTQSRTVAYNMGSVWSRVLYHNVLVYDKNEYLGFINPYGEGSFNV